MPVTRVLRLVPMLFAATAVPAAAQAPRQPTGRWVLDFAATQCLATRNYGNQAEPLTLALKPSAVGNVVQIAVVLPAGRTALGEPRERPVTVRIDERPPIRTSLLALAAKRGELRSFWINLSYAEVEARRAAKRLSFQSPTDLNESFALTAMAPLLAQMDSCLADLKRVWNVAPTQALKSPARARASLASYVSDQDYPGAALVRGEGGATGFALLVDETGRVADCMVTETSGVPVLDAQSCAIFLTRARFEPALDAEGKPAKDAVFSRIRWIAGS